MFLKLFMRDVEIWWVFQKYVKKLLLKSKKIVYPHTTFSSSWVSICGFIVENSITGANKTANLLLEMQPAWILGF